MNKYFTFSIRFIYENYNQVSLNKFNYKYGADEQIEDTLEDNLYNELIDYTTGVGFTSSTGPGGGGLSASLYQTNLLTSHELNDLESSIWMDFHFIELDKNQMTKISSDINHIINEAFNNSYTTISSIYLSPESGYKLDISDPSGATYSFPPKPNSELLKNERDDSVNTFSNKAGGWIIKYLIKLIEPGKPPKQVAPLIATHQSTIEVATQSATQSISDTKITEDKSYVFNVGEIDTLSNLDLGKFILIGEGVIEGFIFQADYESAIIPDEYAETEFLGEDEIFAPTLDYVSVDINYLNNEKGFDPNNPDESLTTDSKYPVSKDKEANIKSMVKVMNERGITNKFTQAAILAIVSKETAFVPRSETTYAKTSAERIKKIFKSFRKYSDSEVDQIKTSAKQFFDIAYGGKFGNGSKEGFLFRGRGFNQLTFRGNYEAIAEKIGIDIVSDPDLLNKVEIASVALSQYFKDRFKSMPDELKSRYNTSGNINDFKTLKDAAGAVYHANAGWGKGYNEILADSTGGRKKTFDRVGALYNNLA